MKYLCKYVGFSLLGATDWVKAFPDARSKNMDPCDDVDEDELALALSTELCRPSPIISDRRTKSFTSLRDPETQFQLSAIRPARLDINSSSRGLREFEPKTIRIHDRSLDVQNNDDSDGLWASNVTVTEPSVVKGNEGEGLQAASGYVGTRLLFSLGSRMQFGSALSKHLG